MRLQTDQSGRMRGYGYVEFETREMLIEALSYNDAVSLKLLYQNNF